MTPPIHGIIYARKKNTDMRYAPIAFYDEKRFSRCTNLIDATVFWNARADSDRIDKLHIIAKSILGDSWDYEIRWIR